jgi:hypothetical protein
MTPYFSIIVFSGPALVCSSKSCFLANQEERLTDLHQGKRSPGNGIVIQPDYEDLAEKKKRAPGMEFVGKRSGQVSEGVNFPSGSFGMEIMMPKAPDMKFNRKLSQGMEFVGKRATNSDPRKQFMVKRAPGMEFVGKRSYEIDMVVKRVPGMEFVGKRSPEKVDYMHLLGNMQANGFMF